MIHSSPTAILLNIGHAMDHWVLVIFLYTVSVIAGAWGGDWKELTPYAFGASFMFGAGSIVSGKLGDQWLKLGTPGPDRLQDLLAGHAVSSLRSTSRCARPTMNCALT